MLYFKHKGCYQVGNLWKDTFLVVPSPGNDKTLAGLASFDFRILWCDTKTSNNLFLFVVAQNWVIFSIYTHFHKPNKTYNFKELAHSLHKTTLNQIMALLNTAESCWVFNSVHCCVHCNSWMNVLLGKMSDVARREWLYCVLDKMSNVFRWDWLHCETQCTEFEWN